ncbi:MAG TPA: hypothetical protein VGJ15_11625 [Pirellulales bacterium]|jgi:hypothetical protein
MSSKPEWKIVLPEPENCTSDPAGDLTGGDVGQSVAEFDAQLPAELRALAQQLVDDADYVAAGAPAGGIKAVERSTRSSRQQFRFRKFAAAVALIAVGAAVATVASRPWENLQPIHPDAAATAKSDDSSNHSAATVAKVAANTIEQRFAEIASKSLQAPPSDNPPRSAGVQEVGFNSAETARKNLNEMEMLRIQVSAFEQVIRRLQANLNRREQEQTETQKTIEVLRQEVTELRRQLDEHETDPNTADN